MKSETLEADLTTDTNAICPACEAAGGTVFFSLPQVPVNIGSCCTDPSTATKAPVGSIALAFCHHCSHVFNSAFEPEKLRYAPGYEIALHHSPVFRRFMESLADRLMDRFELRRKTILEIGAGRGWFLELLCSLGGNRGFGVDPASTSAGPRELDNCSVELIRAYFDQQFADRFSALQPDFVCCLSVLEHVARPADFVAVLRQMIGARNVPLYFEVFNAQRAFRQRETWSVFYEQCNYFGPRSLANLFQRNGFRIVECATCYEGGQYLFVDAISDSLPTDIRAHATKPWPLPEEVQSFSDHFHKHLSSWRQRLASFQAEERRVVFWGSGGKGVSFLNLLPTRDVIRFVAEINPDRQGKFIPGSGQQIVPPEFLREYRPDVVILSNALYEDEIRQQSADLGLECQFYVA